MGLCPFEKLKIPFIEKITHRQGCALARIIDSDSSVQRIYCPGETFRIFFLYGKFVLDQKLTKLATCRVDRYCPVELLDFGVNNQPSDHPIQAILVTHNRRVCSEVMPYHTTPAI